MKRVEGMALPLLLLILLAITAVGHATLLLARRELISVWAFRHAVRAEKAAEAAVDLAFRGLEAPLPSRMPGVGSRVLSGETEDGLGYSGVLRWLDQEFFLLEGTGTSRGWGGERRRGGVGWIMFPEARIGAFLAGAEIGGVLRTAQEGRLEGGDVPAVPEHWPPAACEPYARAIDSLFPSGTLPPTAPLAEEGPRGEGAGAQIPNLGLLTGPRLLEWSLEGADGFSGSPGASRGCPGSSGPVFAGTERAVDLNSGRLCGILAVEEDLQLRGSARFQGLALVGGDLVLEGDAAVEGIVRVAGDLVLEDRSALQARACPVFWALDHLLELQRPIPVPASGPVTGY